VNWLISALLRLICEPRAKPKPTPVSEETWAERAAWMKMKTDRLNAESARLDAQRRREAEIAASAGKCWMCGAGIVTTADVELPVVCIECEDRANPNPPRR